MSKFIKFLSLTFLFLISVLNKNGYAQSFYNLPSDTITKTSYLEDFESITIEQINNKFDTLFLKWQRISAVVPEGWNASICDNKICYTELELSGQMNPIQYASKGSLSLHLTSHLNYGTATITYKVWDIQDTTTFYYLTYIVKVLEPTSIKKVNPKLELTLYPNPAKDYFKIDNLHDSMYDVEIFDAMGKLVLSDSKTNHESIQISDLTNGIYWVQLKTTNGYFIKKLNKQ